MTSEIRQINKKGVHRVCIAKIKVKPEFLEQAIEVFAELMKLSSQEEGCVSYELHQNIDNQFEFTFVDRFKDQTAFDYHCNQEYTCKYFDEILPALTEKIDIQVYQEMECGFAPSMNIYSHV